MTATRSDLQTAIRSLEQALHPNTTGHEIVAAVDGFRRKAKGMRLEDACRTLWDKRTSDGMSLAEFRQDWADRFNEQQAHLTDMDGETNKLRAELDEASRALAESERKVKHLQAQLGRRVEKGGLPAIRNPDIEDLPDSPVENVRSILYPLGHTDLELVEFGDLHFQDVPWNKVRQDVVIALIQGGIPFDEIQRHINNIQMGKCETNGYRYVEQYDLSIKTRSTTEIFRELLRAGQAFAKSHVKVRVHYTDKAARTTGKARGAYAAGSAFPGCEVTIVQRFPPARE
jgi:hypothetical protein